MSEQAIGGNCPHGLPYGDGCDECAAEQELVKSKCHPPTECCNYICPVSIPYPVMWNPYNKVVQCHNCGHVFIPKQVVEAEGE